MSDDAKTKSTQGFVVGVLVAGTIVGGLFLSKQPDAPAPVTAPAPMAAPMASPSFAPAAPAVPESPRETADLLFNQAMMANEQNDEAGLAQVLPGALAAYRALGELDDDGSYHVALLQLAGGKLSEARATSAGLLAKNPHHLLALAVSMHAAQKANDAAAARDFAQRILKAYDAEVGQPLPEYRDHGRMLPTYRAEALTAAK